MDKGFHVPVIDGELLDIKGKTVAELFWQNGPIELKMGTIEFVIVIIPVVFTTEQLIPVVVTVYG